MAIWSSLQSVWPDLDWHRMKIRSGAFHLVAVLGETAVVRVAFGAGHAERTRTETANLAAFALAGLPFRIPAVLREPFHGNGWSAQANSFVPGEHRPLERWETVRAPLKLALAALAGMVPPAAGALRPVRQWCGAGEWPAVVAGITAGLPPKEAKAASRVVAQVLAAEEMVHPVVVHGDFGLHNVLWVQSKISGLVDFDNACLGDPAMDLAPLISAFGAAAVADIAGPDIVARAQLHRASLSLQVAAAGHLAGDHELREFALGNFSDRFRRGTLYDPGPPSGPQGP